MRLFGPKKRVVATVGYPDHGKSVFLAGLFWDSFFELSRIFYDEHQPHSVRAITEEANKVFYSNARMLHDLLLPPANPRIRPQPAGLEFRGVPDTDGSRRNIELIFYDIAGEVFTNDTQTREYAPYVAQADDFIFLFDPAHPEFNALSAAQLIDLVYRNSKRADKINIIIALTKIDESRPGYEWLTESLDNHWSYPLRSAHDLPYYFDQMESLSGILRSWWLDDEQKAHSLIGSLPKNTQYSVISSLGHKPVWACAECLISNSISSNQCIKCGKTKSGAVYKLAQKPEPFRVRDPLFWIFRAAKLM